MQYRRKFWQAVGVVGLTTAMSLPTLGHAQTQGQDTQGFNSREFLRSTAAGYPSISGNAQELLHCDMEPGHVEQPVAFQTVAWRGGQQEGRASGNLYEQNFAPGEFFTQAERDLVERVRANLVLDPRLAPVVSNLDIGAERGTIILHGSVPTARTKERIVRQTEQMLGVMRVEDQLQVSGGTAAVEPRDRVAEAGVVAPQPVPPVPPGKEVIVVPSGTEVVVRPPLATSFPATGDRRYQAADDQALTGSGQMHQEDRTGTTGPSGSRTTSPLNTGAIDPIGRVTKPAGDYAVTENDRELASRVRFTFQGHPAFPAADENLHIKVNNGIVSLYGWVDSEQEREAITEKVRNMAGVQGVENHLQVRLGRTGSLG